MSLAENYHRETVRREHQSDWSDERIELLKTRWAEGRSASEIATELGGVTRNAVIGKVHRLGLAGRKRKARAASIPRPNRKPHPLPFDKPPDGFVRRTWSWTRHAKIDPPQPEPEIIDNIIPFGQRRTLLELNKDTCRWPIGDPQREDFFFCGGKPLTGLPYCPYHSRVAYRPDARR